MVPVKKSTLIVASIVLFSVLIITGLKLSDTLVSFDNRTSNEINYKSSVLFRQYLDTWKILPNSIIKKIFRSDEYKYKKLTLVLLEKPPKNPNYIVSDENMNPNETIYSTTEKIIQNELELSIYINPKYESMRQNFYTDTIQWLILSTLYQKSKTELPNDEFYKELQPYYKAVTSDESNSFIIYDDK